MVDRIKPLPVGIIDGINENNLQADIQLFPNPAKEQLTLVVETPEPLDKVEIRILDVSGKLLWQTDRKQSAVIMEEIIPLEAFLAGVYFLEIYSANKFASCRWVKID